MAPLVAEIVLDGSIGTFSNELQAKPIDTEAMKRAAKQFSDEYIIRIAAPVPAPLPIINPGDLVDACQCASCVSARQALGLGPLDLAEPGLSEFSDADLDAFTTPDSQWCDLEFAEQVKAVVKSWQVERDWADRYWPATTINPSIEALGFERVRTDGYTIFIHRARGLVLKRCYRPYTNDREPPPTRAIPEIRLWGSKSEQRPIVLQPLADVSEETVIPLWIRIKGFKMSLPASTRYKIFDPIFGRDDHMRNYGIWKGAIVAIDY